MPPNLLVFNVQGNDELKLDDYETLEALTSVKIVNPKDPIFKVSCFQNFGRVALGDEADYVD